MLYLVDLYQEIGISLRTSGYTDDLPELLSRIYQFSMRHESGVIVKILIKIRK